MLRARVLGPDVAASSASKWLAEHVKPIIDGVPDVLIVLVSALAMPPVVTEEWEAAEESGIARLVLVTDLEAPGAADLDHMVGLVQRMWDPYAQLWWMAALDGDERAAGYADLITRTMVDESGAITSFEDGHFEVLDGYLEAIWGLSGELDDSEAPYEMWAHGQLAIVGSLTSVSSDAADSSDRWLEGQHVVELLRRLEF